MLDTLGSVNKISFSHVLILIDILPFSQPGLCGGGVGPENNGFFKRSELRSGSMVDLRVRDRYVETVRQRSQGVSSWL